jgi:hypothetical protein
MTTTHKGATKMTTNATKNERRVIRSAGWVIVQVAQADGSWWNITITRETGS